MENNKNIKEKITWDRMCEIATKALHKLLEDDEAAAIEFFREDLDLLEEESEYFEVPTEIEEHEFTCNDCPYYWRDHDGDIPYCHHDDSSPAFCEIE